MKRNVPQILTCLCSLGVFFTWILRWQLPMKHQHRRRRRPSHRLSSQAHRRDHRCGPGVPHRSTYSPADDPLGDQGIVQGCGGPVPPGLGRRVSGLTSTDQLAPFTEVWPKSHAKPIAAKVLDEALLNGLLGDVSGGAFLVSEKDRVVMEQTEGNRYVGIHIALGMDDKEKRPLIREVIEGGPADLAGVKDNDLIELIDGVDTKDMELREAVDRLRGQEGTDVTIKVHQPKTKSSRTYTVTRGQHARVRRCKGSASDPTESGTAASMQPPPSPTYESARSRRAPHMICAKWRCRSRGRATKPSFSISGASAERRFILLSCLPIPCLPAE